MACFEFPSLGLLAVSLFGVLAASVPTQSNMVSQTGNFTIHQVRNPSFTRSGVRDMVKTYSKYLKYPPKGIANIRTSGRTPAMPQPYGTEYLCPVSIGTPPQVVQLDFDTGSADTWVSGPDMGKITGQTPYDPDLSSTSQHTNMNWEIEYADLSSAGGIVYYDVVDIGGVSYPHQAVEVAVKESDAFTSQTASSGYLGLSFGSLNSVSPNKQKTFFENVKGQLDAPLFAANLRHGAAGSYDFGVINPSAYKGNIIYTAVDPSEGFWNITASGYNIGPTTDPTRATEPITGVIDTGATLLYLPSDIIGDYYRQIAGAKSQLWFWTVPCNGPLPSFSLMIEGTPIEIPGDYLRWEPYDVLGDCVGGMQSSDDIGFAVFGNMAIEAAYVVWEDGASGPRVGWAAKDLS